jgi:hypothetical protein
MVRFRSAHHLLCSRAEEMRNRIGHLGQVTRCMGNGDAPWNTSYRIEDFALLGQRQELAG